MTYPKLAIHCLVAAALTAGCKSPTSQPAVGTQPASAVQLDKAKVATAEAAQAMEDYAFARKAEFVAKMKSELAATQEEIDRLAARIESTSGAAKDDAMAKLVLVTEKWTKTKQQLNQAENATESTWNDVKKGFKESYANVKDSIAATRLWLSEKIAP